jgi:putative acetyltransferase
MLTIVRGDSPGRLPSVKEIFEEYAASLDIDLRFQHFDEELSALPGEYSPPGGAILLAYDEGKLAGCAALRRLDGDICEMKRLYVRPAFRRKGVGRALAEAVIEHARTLGYALIKLDTLGSMQAANALYASLGFKPCDPYRYNPCPSPIFMELPLRGSRHRA